MPSFGIPFKNANSLILGEMLARNSRKYPDKTALVYQARRFTYSEFNGRVNALARSLLARNIGRGETIGILLYNSNEMVELFFACNKIGAVAVPINFRLSGDEINYIVAHVDAAAIVYEADLEPAAASVHHLDQMKLKARVRGGGSPFVPGTVEFEDLTAGSTEEPQIEVDETDVAFIMHTSGTTGRPKGAVLTHRNLYLNTLNWIMEVGADSDSVWVSGLQLFHIGGLDGILPFVFLGGKNVILPSTGFDPQGALSLLEREKATHCYFVPTQWLMITESSAARGTALPRLRKALWGASGANLNLLRTMHKTFPAVEIINAFGQTEMSSNTTFLKGADADRKIGSVGKPVANLEVRIVDDEGFDVADGQIGEIVYRGPTVFKEYYREEAATAEALRGGWFHSGDLVQRDAEGFIYVVDRKKDMIISGGENIYPAEIERVLNDHPKIRESAVIGVPDEKWVETPLAVVVLKAGATMTENKIISYCKSKLASYKKPSRVIFSRTLPRNPAGKLQKKILKDDVLKQIGKGGKADRNDQ